MFATVSASVHVKNTRFDYSNSSRMIAQVGERRTLDHKVEGSTPTLSPKITEKLLIGM